MKKTIFSLLILGASFSFGKNLAGRAAFGVSLQDLGALPALSARYHFSQALSATFIAGFNTDSSRNATSVGAKILQNMHLEENLNFFLGMGALIVSDKENTASATSSGIEFDGIIGAEFFLSGLPNLGLMFETGVALRTIRTVAFRTIGSGFANAAIHYYF